MNIRKSVSTTLFICLIFLLFIGNMSGKTIESESLFSGHWQGPHPELKHIKFLFQIQYNPESKWTGKGFWVDNNIYHAHFSLDKISVEKGNIKIEINDWGCVYNGKLTEDGNSILGGFTCKGELPDTVAIKRVNKSQFFGLFPEHLNSEGKFLYTYQVPPQKADGLITGHLSESGLQFDVISQMVAKIATNKYGRFHSLLIVKGGKLICEEYFYGFSRDVLHPMESTTKSITSLLMGIAFDKHKNCSLNDDVVNYFPEYNQFPKNKKESLKIKHLLTMTSGKGFDEREMVQSTDRLAYLLQREFNANPGEKFYYNAGNTELLGGIVKSTTGMFADDFAEKYLFEQLKITEYRWDEYKQNGYPLCGGSLWLKPRDMAKIGLLILNKGRWQSKKIISKQWLDESTKGQVETGIGSDKYGYQWWVSDVKSGDNSYHLIWANGLGSQFIFIFPELNMVIVTTGGNWEGGNNGRSWDIFEMFQEYLLKL